MNIELDYKEIGKRIQRFRLEKKMTQDNLAELIGTDQKYISRIELGSHKLYFNTAVAIARALSISIDALIANSADSRDESNIKLIVDDIKYMSPKQLDMLRDHIATIKKY